MRGAFAKTLTELAERDSRVMLLTADLGFMALEPFAEKFPDRFVNVGVAEQNMIGLATGLAEAGFIPFVYSIVTFAALRGYEFFRNGAILHQLPVRVVAIGGGFEYGHAGPTHHGLEDVAVMRTQPGLTVIAPADAQQTRSAMLATWDLPGPIYYRLGKNDKIVVPGLDGRFELGRTQVIREGSDLLILGMGGIASEVASAAEQLTAQGISAAAAVVASINPVPEADLTALLSQFPVVLTVEAHYTVGGLGSLVAEVAADKGLGCRVVRCGVNTTPDGVSGSQRYLEQRHGISHEAIVQAAIAQLSR
jgi:transketolase